MHEYNVVLTILGLACFLCFCKSCFFIEKVTLTVLLLCLCAFCLDRLSPKWPIYCVGQDVKPYSLTHVCVLVSYFVSRHWNSHSNTIALMPATALRYVAIVYLSLMHLAFVYFLTRLPFLVLRVTVMLKFCAVCNNFHIHCVWSFPAITYA